MGLKPTSILLTVLLTALAGGCARPSADGQTQSRAEMAQGQSTYQALCAPCHDADDLRLLTVPPKLDGLFSKPKLPGGEPTTDQNVRDVILHGKGIMPPFEHSLTNEQVDALIQYLHTK